MKIDLTELFGSFDQHLEISSRVFFSGKFGSGKTTYLKEFFEEENNKNKYECFHLYPVNYQIYENRDVIELLKYDILIELLEKNPKLDKELAVGLVQEGKELLNYAKGNLNETLTVINSINPFLKLQKPIKEALKYDKEFQKKRPSKKIKNFKEEISKKNISETDFISAYINNELKTSVKAKKSVLILDDLDRMDLEHIFRILNVFSAHQDQFGESKNKFGFDHVILVGDCDNIRSLFHHKYGSSADFDGYFDKFYSLEVFEFSNVKIIKGVVGSIVSSFKTGNEEKKKELEGYGNYLPFFLEEIIKESYNLPKKDRLTLRKLMKANNTCIPALTGKNKIRRDITHPYGLFHCISNAIEALITIFGSKDDLIRILRAIQENTGHGELQSEVPGLNRFSTSFLKYILNRKEEEVDQYINWENFSLTLNGDQIRSVTHPKKENINQKFLFYELLIFYTKNGYYEKDLYKEALYR